MSATTPFVASLAPREKARALGAPVEVELLGVQPGELRTVAAGALNPACQRTTMKTSTIEVGELVSTLSAADVGQQLSTLPGAQVFSGGSA